MECDLAHFVVLVQQQARRAAVPRDVFLDPAGAALAFVARNPETAEAQLLVRFMAALQVRAGAFRVAEVYVLGREALTIAALLVEAAVQGLPTRHHDMPESLVHSINERQAQHWDGGRSLSDTSH
jgi:hypothetical protein